MTILPLPRRPLPVLLTLVFLTAGPGLAQPRTQLSTETIESFDSYVTDAVRVFNHRVEGRLPFLWADDNPDRRINLRGGKVLIDPIEGIPSIRGGMLHGWIGAMYVPETTAAQVLAVLQDYDRHKEWYPEVIDSRVISRDGDVIRGYQRLLKKKVLTVVLDTDHEVEWSQVDDARWIGKSRSTRIQEVRSPGSPGENLLPVGEDSGFLWRLYAGWRLEQDEGGVFVECVSVSLSRQVPRGLGWMINPFVTSLPRESLESTLQATRLAAKGVDTGP